MMERIAESRRSKGVHPHMKAAVPQQIRVEEFSVPSQYAWAMTEN
jgi:hypothetical protein